MLLRCSSDKDESKKDAECEAEEVKIEKPPSPRMTRARKQTMNWTEEEINRVKEGEFVTQRYYESVNITILGFIMFLVCFAVVLVF